MPTRHSWIISPFTCETVTFFPLDPARWKIVTKPRKKEQQMVEPNEIRTRCERDGERYLNHHWLNATFLNNPRKAQLSQKVWQLWDIQWQNQAQSAYARKSLEASEVLSPSWTQQFWTIRVRASYHRKYGSYKKYNGNNNLRMLVQEKIWKAPEVLPPSWTQQFWAIQESSCYHRSCGSYGKRNGTAAIRIVNHTKASFLNAYPQLNAMRGDFPC